MDNRHIFNDHISNLTNQLVIKSIPLLELHSTWIDIKKYFHN